MGLYVDGEVGLEVNVYLPGDDYAGMRNHAQITFMRSHEVNDYQKDWTSFAIEEAIVVIHFKHSCSPWSCCFANSV